MVDKEQLANSKVEGFIGLYNYNIPKYYIKQLYLDGFNDSETYYKDIAVKFATYLLKDFEMIDLDADRMGWQLAGTNQNYTTKELFDLFLKELENE